MRCPRICGRLASHWQQLSGTAVREKGTAQWVPYVGCTTRALALAASSSIGILAAAAKTGMRGTRGRSRGLCACPRRPAGPWDARCSFRGSVRQGRLERTSKCMQVAPISLRAPARSWLLPSFVLFLPSTSHNINTHVQTTGGAAGPGPCMRHPPAPPPPRVLRDSGGGAATNKCP